MNTNSFASSQSLMAIGIQILVSAAFSAFFVGKKGTHFTGSHLLYENHGTQKTGQTWTFLAFFNMTQGNFENYQPYILEFLRFYADYLEMLGLIIPLIDYLGDANLEIIKI